jgi:sensor histidine kinase YesM
MHLVKGHLGGNGTSPNLSQLQKYAVILILVCFVFLPPLQKAVSAQVRIVLTDSTRTSFIGKSVYYLVDSTERLSFEQVTRPGLASQFVKSGVEVLNFGNKQRTVWNRFTVENRSTKRWILSALNDNDYVTFYYQDSSGIYRQVNLGVAERFSARKYKTNHFAFDLPVKKGDQGVFYLRVKTRNVEYALSISSEEAFVENQFISILLIGIYYGFVLLITIYNTALFIAMRDKAYLYYIIYVLFTALLIAVLTGVYPFIIGDNFHFLWNAGPTITALGGIFFFLFADSFLNLKTHAPRLKKVINYIFIPALAFNIILNLVNESLLASISNQIFGMLGLFFMLATAIYVYLKGYKAARFYILACSFYLVGVSVFILKAFVLLPYNYFTRNAIEIGSALEMIMFSVSMGDRINIYRKEKARAQLELIASLQAKTQMQHDMLELEAKALRSQMDPHFIFNCMNSIKSLIQQSEEDKAVTYLTTFSKLLRTILQNADKREITLHDEIETCKLYMQLESLRFGNKFSYTFSIDAQIDLKSIQLPALILQPYIENAIWHGIMPKEEGGFIKVCIEKNNDSICCIIDDDGIGRELSLKSKFRHQQSTHQSKGVKLTQSRLDLDNALNNRNATVESIDKKDENENALGTTVILTFKEY